MNGDAGESGDDDANSESTSYTIRFVPTDRSVCELSPSDICRVSVILIKIHIKKIDLQIKIHGCEFGV